MYKVDTKVMERIRFYDPCDKIFDVSSWHLSRGIDRRPLGQGQDVVRLVVAFVLYSEMTESNKLKEAAEADLLDATGVFK